MGLHNYYSISSALTLAFILFITLSACASEVVKLHTYDSGKTVVIQNGSTFEVLMPDQELESWVISYEPSIIKRIETSESEQSVLQFNALSPGDTQLKIEKRNKNNTNNPSNMQFDFYIEVVN